MNKKVYQQREKKKKSFKSIGFFLFSFPFEDSLLIINKKIINWPELTPGGYGRITPHMGISNLNFQKRSQLLNIPEKIFSSNKKIVLPFIYVSSTLTDFYKIIVLNHFNLIKK